MYMCIKCYILLRRCAYIVTYREFFFIHGGALLLQKIRLLYTRFIAAENFYSHINTSRDQKKNNNASGRRIVKAILDLLCVCLFVLSNKPADLHYVL